MVHSNLGTATLRMFLCNDSGIDHYNTTTEVKECNQRNLLNKSSTVTESEVEGRTRSITSKDHNSIEISTNQCQCITVNVAISTGVILSVLFLILITLIAIVIAISIFHKRKQHGWLLIHDTWILHFPCYELLPM